MRYGNLYNLTDPGFYHWTPILTDEGLCFSFNIFGADDMFTDAA